MPCDLNLIQCILEAFQCLQTGVGCPYARINLILALKLLKYNVFLQYHEKLFLVL